MQRELRFGLFKETIRIAWPAVLESFFVALAGMIDTLMVASVGSYAVAAVGLTNQPKFLVLAFFFSANVAVSALVARRRGEERRDNANEILCSAFCYTIIACVIFTIFCLIIAAPLMRLCGSNADTHESATLYYRIIMGGMFFNVVSLVINAAQRGSGNTRIAMTTNVTSSVVNVCFNYLLIGGHLGFPKLGIAGAAIATVLGTVVACVMSISSLFRKDSYVHIGYIIENHIKPTFNTLKNIIRLGVGFLIENFAMRVGFMATALMAAGLGTDAFAAHQVGMNLLSLGFAFGDGMQVAAVALIGRSLGEKKTEKAKEYGNICQHVGLIISLCITATLFFFGRQLMRLYFSEEHIIEMGVLITRFIMLIVLAQISQIIYAGCLRGAGDVRFCLLTSLISVTLIRTCVTYVLVSIFHLGLVGIWCGVLADQVSRIVLLSVRFYQGKWVHVKI